MITPDPSQLTPRKTHRVRNGFIIMGSIFVALAIIGIFTNNGSSNTSGQTSVSTSPPNTTPTQQAENSSPPPVANPSGKYAGSCDYTLGNGFNGNYHVIGEIDLTNTGNVGVIVHTRITWPQEGASPITARKTIHLPVGAVGKPVRFHVAASSNEIDLLQSWQERHNYKDGCTYHAAFADTYGPVSG